MKVNANTLRTGHVLERNKKLWVVLKTNTIKPGKGGAFIQVEMKDILSGTKTVERFRTQEDIERAYLDERSVQFLYVEGTYLIFMDTENFEQLAVSQDTLGDLVPFLQDGMICTAQVYEERVIAVQLPPTVQVVVKEAEPVTKNQTAASSYKSAVLENGVRVMVPPYIETGMRIVISTADLTYQEREKG